jgi:hypothetical protein
LGIRFSKYKKKAATYRLRKEYQIIEAAMKVSNFSLMTQAVYFIIQEQGLDWVRVNEVTSSAEDEDEPKKTCTFVGFLWPLMPPLSVTSNKSYYIVVAFVKPIGNLH